LIILEILDNGKKTKKFIFKILEYIRASSKSSIDATSVDRYQSKTPKIIKSFIFQDSSLGPFT